MWLSQLEFRPNGSCHLVVIQLLPKLPAMAAMGTNRAQTGHEPGESGLQNAYQVTQHGKMKDARAETNADWAPVVRILLRPSAGIINIIAQCHNRMTTGIPGKVRVMGNVWKRENEFR